MCGGKSETEQQNKKMCASTFWELDQNDTYLTDVNITLTNWKVKYHHKHIINLDSHLLIFQMYKNNLYSLEMDDVRGGGGVDLDGIIKRSDVQCSIVASFITLEI